VQPYLDLSYQCCAGLRLANGTSRSSGLLETYSTDGWIPVCYFTNYTEEMANAACRQLGYPYYLSYQSTNASSDRSIVIANESCTSLSDLLTYCVTGGIDNCTETTMLTCDGKLLTIALAFFIPAL